MKAYTQNLLSAPAKILQTVKKGRKIVPLTRTTKSGQVKNVYKVNPDSHIIKQIKHKPFYEMELASTK